ncbi:MAG: response regulator [Solirubrobacterales bacterium]
MRDGPESSCPLVLVADDEQDILELIRMVLEEEGYEVIAVSDGVEALRTANQRRPDLCVLDVMMPGVDGYDVTRVLKRDEELRRIPVVLLTARTEPENVARGREAGADEYLSKPFLPEELQQAVRSVLSESASANGRSEEHEPGVAVEPEIPLEPEPAPPQPAGGVVLLAGANEYLLNAARYRLELGGYEVAVTASAERGLELAAELVPDVFVVDAASGQVDPDSVAKLLQARATGSIPVLPLANGGPFDPQELFIRVEAALGRA